MIAQCGQFTYTDEELASATYDELSHTLAAIKEVRPQLIGNIWPSVLDAQRIKIETELERRTQELLD